MPEFHCRLATPAGEIVERTYESHDEASLRRDLEDKDLLVLDLRRSNPFTSQLAALFRFGPRVSSKEFLLFNQELSALLKAGLPVLQSLDVLLERRDNATFKRALGDIRERVRGGESLSEAFSAQGEMFPKLYAATLSSGERTGELPVVLRRYITYSRNLLAVRKKVVSALVYPAILVALMIGLIGLFLFFILPKFREFLTDFGVALPLPTRILLGVAQFAIDHWTAIVLSVAGGIIGLSVWKRTPAGRVAVDRAVLRVPLIGGIVRDYAQNRFTRTLATLLTGGIPLVTALEIGARAVGNAVFEDGLLRVAGRVREGRSLWESLDELKLVAPIAIEMIKVGESTGSLPDMLNDVSDFVDQEIDHKVQRLVSLIEPMLLVFMAFVIGGMLLAVYYPMIQAYGQSQL
jgi:type IV pilus assembly protein PilC